jgi:sporulation protein YlmC with PRC-barrel domain
MTADRPQVDVRNRPDEQRRQVLAHPGRDHILGSDLRGTVVYGANNEEIGEVNEIVISRDGQVVALVVGVGGFLGIGEKDVAIPFKAVEIAATNANAAGTIGAGNRGDRNDDQRAMTNTPLDPERIVLRGMTKQELEAAPSFKTER